MRRANPGAALLMVVIAVVSAGAGAAGAQVEDRVMAEVDGEAITAEVIDELLGYRAYQLKRDLYHLRRQKLNDLIEEKLLQREATTRGISVERLLEQEVNGKVRVTDQEVEIFYREHKDSIQGGDDAARAAVRRYLEEREQGDQRRRLVETLKARVGVRDYLTAPRPTLGDYLVVPGASSKGLKNAPITIVEFSDFQCPFCAKAQTVLQQVLETYPHDVRLVYRHFPLKRHPQAKLAAEAAECAARQGRFWEYHDQLFADAQELNRDKLRALAEGLRLDVESFDGCLDAGQTRKRVAEDVADAREAGVTGTPTFFINRRMVEGAQPFATFKRMIDRELALRGRSRGAVRQ